MIKIHGAETETGVRVMIYPKGEFVEAIWFSDMKGCCGIIVIKDEETKEKKIMIGVVPGQNEEADLRHIKEWGTEITPGVQKHILRVQTQDWGNEIYRLQKEYSELKAKLDKLIPLEVIERLKEAF